jgi:hypothetical protein
VKCFLRRTDTGLVADDEMAEDVLRKIKPGTFVRVEVVQERNVKHHRLFWVMCAKLGAAVDLPANVIADVLKIRTGHYRLVETLDGHQFKIASSISYAALDQTGFRAFFDACCKEICFAWLPHMTPGRWRKEVLQMMGIQWDEDDAEAIQAPSGTDESDTTDDIRANRTRGRT